MDSLNKRYNKGDKNWVGHVKICLACVIIYDHNGYIIVITWGLAIYPIGTKETKKINFQYYSVYIDTKL